MDLEIVQAVLYTLRSAPIKLGFKATGARELWVSRFYRHIAPLERGFLTGLLRALLITLTASAAPMEPAALPT